MIDSYCLEITIRRYDSGSAYLDFNDVFTQKNNSLCKDGKWMNQMREVAVFSQISSLNHSQILDQASKRYKDIILLDTNLNFLKSVSLKMYSDNHIGARLFCFAVQQGKTGRDFKDCFNALSTYVNIKFDFLNTPALNLTIPAGWTNASLIEIGDLSEKSQLVVDATRKSGNANEVELAILLIQFDAYELTRDCITSLYATSYSNKVIYLMENSSNDFSSLNLFLDFPELIVLNPHMRISYTQSFNALAGAAIRNGSKWLFLTNNDTRDFQTDIFEILISNLKGDIAMISPRILDFTNEDIHWRPRIKLGIQFNIATEAFLMTSSTWEMLGGFDESFVMYFEDLEFLLRLRGHGFDGTLTTECSMAHYGSASTGTMIFIPTFYPIRNAIWVMRKSGLSIPKVLTSVHFINRLKLTLKRILQENKKGSRGVMFLKIFYLICGVVAGVFFFRNRFHATSFDQILSRKFLPLKYRFK